MIWIIMIVSLVVATIIVNGTQQLFMKVLNLSGMFINTKTKVITIVFLALVLAAIVIKVFGIQI